jgi:hypothetical protein
VRFKPRIYLACFLIHFLLIVSVCTRDTCTIVADGFTSLPDSFKKYGEIGAEASGIVLGDTLPIHHPIRQTETIYLNAGGIELGYSFFAPAIPSSFKLVFEIHYPDGHVEYDLPRVHEGGGGSRLVRCLEQIGRLEYEPLREMMLKMLAYREWQEHPNATHIRAVFGFIQIPTRGEAQQGKTETYRFLYAYDFGFAGRTEQQQGR